MLKGSSKAGFRKLASAASLMAFALAASADEALVSRTNVANAPAASTASAPSANPHAKSIEANWKLLEDYCLECHNATDWAGGVAFDTLDPASAAEDAEIWEESVRKLRGTLMPPPGKKQPDAATRAAFISSFESFLDNNAATQPHPGSVGLHRLNRTEYANAIEDMLGLRIDPSLYLPRDDKSDGFDNAADVLKVSPSFLEQYMAAAREVSIAAVGNPKARVQSRIYKGTGEYNPYVHQDGLPLGTRGGILVDHDFPADGEYEFTISGLVGAGYLWGVMDENTLIITIDGERIFEQKLGGEKDLESVDVRQAQGVGEIDARFKAIRRKVKAGPHKVGITYVAKTAAEHIEVLHGFNSVVGMGVHVNGNSDGPRIQNVEIKGPFNPTGVSETPSRRKIFTCMPKAAAEEQACAEKILAGVARKAFRRPVISADLTGAMSFYKQGHEQGGFETGIQKGLMAILVSPKFLYRAHTPPPGTQPGQAFRINDLDLASRLSYFLWSRGPDDTLIDLAVANKLHEPEVLNAQVRRMLADPRASALVTNFAFQWLNIGGLQLVEPDPNLFPDYTPVLIEDFSKEMELFIGNIFKADRSVVDLLTSDETFVNERLALHYGVRGVRGGQFQKITWKEPHRRGLFGKGAFLMVTSYANRTTPVLRGAYILEKFLGTAPASPPPDVQAFVETQEGEMAKTVRERLEAHRNVQSCNQCHGVIDPLGIALENYNAIGQWRDKDIDAGSAIDAGGAMADGTKLTGVDDLRNAMVARREQFVQTFTEHLMTFALGRGVKYYDMPRVRAIVRDSAKQDYRLSSIVLGIVASDAFQMAEVPKPEQHGQHKTASNDSGAAR
jgi:mono/diheme cytochrome c family protein